MMALEVKQEHMDATSTSGEMEWSQHHFPFQTGKATSGADHARRWLYLQLLEEF